MSNGINRIKIELLDKRTFAEFGDVIEVDNSDYFMINNGSTRRYHKLAEADVEEQGGKAIISIFQATPLQYPLTIEMLERHPLARKHLYHYLDNRILSSSRRREITRL
ncbi:ureidoglycolate hydrolase [Vibrio maritimus]|uniref:Ureidoglycolate hydrolase n=1 Tax=Vibrio maritimus TaxID=990268 RepID=A0A090T7P3_9VIBR|nr:ureidoglycolate hydrolase [Vibrio maritimus]